MGPIVIYLPKWRARGNVGGPASHKIAITVSEDVTCSKADVLICPLRYFYPDARAQRAPQRDRLQSRGRRSLWLAPRHPDNGAAPRRTWAPAGLLGGRGRRGQTFQARRDVHAVAQDVAVLDNEATEVDADAELDGCSSGAAASRSATPRWVATAHSTASTTLANSTGASAPMSLATRP